MLHFAISAATASSQLITIHLVGLMGTKQFLSHPRFFAANPTLVGNVCEVAVTTGAPCSAAGRECITALELPGLTTLRHAQ